MNLHHWIDRKSEAATQKEDQNLFFKTDYRLMQVKYIGHSAILSTFIKLPFAIKTFVLSSFEWRLRTDFTVEWTQCVLKGACALIRSKLVI